MGRLVRHLCRRAFVLLILYFSNFCTAECVGGFTRHLFLRASVLFVASCFFMSVEHDARGHSRVICSIVHLFCWRLFLLLSRMRGRIRMSFCFVGQLFCLLLYVCCYCINPYTNPCISHSSSHPCMHPFIYVRSSTHPPKYSSGQLAFVIQKFLPR